MAVGLYSGVSGLAIGVGLYKGVSGLWGGSSGLINGFGGSGPFPGASLYLDFLTPPLDPRITFSRGSNATLVDATGKITYAPANLALYSEDFTNAYWTKTNITLTSGITDPNGGTAAFTFAATASNGTVSRNLGSLAVGTLISCFVRRRTGSGAVALWDGNSYVDVTVTSSWARVYISQEVLSAGFWDMRLAVSGDAVDVAFPQAEQVTYQTTPAPYVATTASAYYGPRFDYDPVTLAPKGLLIEEARTNLVTYSSAIGGTNWVQSAATATLNNTVAPDGTTTATLITESSTTAAHAVYGTSATFSATAHTVSVFIKAGTRRYVSIRGETTAASTYAWITFDTQTGAINANAAVTSSSATVFGNGWWRVTMTWPNITTSFSNIVISGSDVSTAPVVATLLGNSYLGNGSTFYVWGAQVEAGSFATSYIPTVASTVTRSADVATMTGTNFSSWYNQSAGTLVVSATGYNAPTVAQGSTSPTAASLYAAAAGNSYATIAITRRDVAVLNSPTAYVISDAGVTGIDIPQSSISWAGATVNAAFAWNGSTDAAFTANGAAVGTDNSYTLPTSDSLQIGRWGSEAVTGYWSGHIRFIVFYNTRLPNAQLVSLTAPSLATTLTMSFTDQAYTVGV